MRHLYRDWVFEYIPYNVQIQHRTWYTIVYVETEETNTAVNHHNDEWKSVADYDWCACRSFANSNHLHSWKETNDVTT